MIHVVCFSGGKDSTALVLWAKEHLKGENIVYLFCDTKWEHQLTYDYIEKINQELLDGKLITLYSTKYGGMENLIEKRNRIPTAVQRFCTGELKIMPMFQWILEQSDDLTIYQGIRAEESRTRSLMSAEEEYFKAHIKWDEAGKGSEYRKKNTKPKLQDAVMAYLDDYSVDVKRPLFDWTWQQVFDLMRKHNVEPNPLYKMGMSRVGCMPCVMCNNTDLKNIAQKCPEAIDRVRKLEKKMGRSFFPWKRVPDHFCEEPTIDDLVRWVSRHDKGETDLFEGGSSCMSIYNLCE